MNAADQAGGMAAVEVAAEGSAPSVAPPQPASGDSLSRLPPRHQDSQLTEDDEDEVVEQDPTGESGGSSPARSRVVLERRACTPHFLQLTAGGTTSHGACRPLASGRLTPREPAGHPGYCQSSDPALPPSPPLRALAAGRYSRYRQQVGSGRFKNVFKGFDERQGIDVAWSKIEADPNNLSHEQMKKIVDDISYGLGLDHPHIIKVRRRRGVLCGGGCLCGVYLLRGCSTGYAGFAGTGAWAACEGCSCAGAGQARQQGEAQGQSGQRPAPPCCCAGPQLPPAPPALPALLCPALCSPQCFQCWEDAEQGCINMVTEFFTSGALRCAHIQPHTAAAPSIAGVWRCGRHCRVFGEHSLHRGQPACALACLPA